MTSAIINPFIEALDFGTAGVSVEAEEALALDQDVLRKEAEAFSYDDGRGQVFDEIDATVRECSRPGWDGYGADPVESRTSDRAERFVRALPHGTPMPTVGADPDGHLTLEWYRSRDWVLSISISPEGILYYAALLGTSKASGTESFLGHVPPSILLLVERLNLG